MPGTFQRVAAAVPATLPAVLDVDGSEVVLFRVDDRYYAISRWCPHRGADLQQGNGLGTQLKCPHHGFTFDLANGTGISHPGLDVNAYEVRVEPDGLYLRRRLRSAPSVWG